MNEANENSWSEEEFSRVDLGDKRLNKRLINLCESLSDAPESPINQACEDWAETKSAYRFFQNEKVNRSEILAAHSAKTARRAQAHETILAIQDTSYFNYTSHPKTEGLGEISMKKGKNVKEIYSHGLAMHACLAVTTQGLPLGLLSQKITARKSRPTRGKASERDQLPIEEKESFRWLESLNHTKEVMGDCRAVTVCDRECDIYDFFKRSNEIGAPVLVRASSDRTINRKSRYAEKEVVKLWNYMMARPSSGSYSIEIPHRSKSKHNSERLPRSAEVTVRFGAFQLNAPRNHPQQKAQQLPDIEMNAIYVVEENPPEGEDVIEWMLLTNLAVSSFQEACEIVRWYSLRWRIEMFFKVLKSGFRVEACRLAHGERLARYLTVMSIVAWRLFMITLIARTDPEQCSSSLLSEHEWRVLRSKSARNNDPNNQPPTIKQAVAWIAKLGGHLGRKCDGPPGTITLWRGWKRLTDLCEGVRLAENEGSTCG